MKPLQTFGPKRCVMCRRAYAPNKGTAGTWSGVKVWMCFSCEAKFERMKGRA